MNTKAKIKFYKILSFLFLMACIPLYSHILGCSLWVASAMIVAQIFAFAFISFGIGEVFSWANEMRVNYQSLPSTRLAYTVLYLSFSSLMFFFVNPDLELVLKMIVIIYALTGVLHSIRHILFGDGTPEHLELLRESQ